MNLKVKRSLESLEDRRNFSFLKSRIVNLDLFIESENVLTALHPENEDFLSYNGEEMLPIDEVVLALEGNKLK